MKQQHVRFAIAAALAAMCAPAAHAIDVTAGDWKLSFDGNVNADYIYSNCASLDSAKIIGGGLTCVAPGDGQRSSSSVSNGLLPAALSISAATTQAGYDIGVTFGLYPGISTNDGGSPNLGNTSTHSQHRPRHRRPRCSSGFPDLRQQGHGHRARRPQHRPVRRGCDPE